MRLDSDKGDETDDSDFGSEAAKRQLSAQDGVSLRVSWLRWVGCSVFGCFRSESLGFERFRYLLSGCMV